MITGTIAPTSWTDVGGQGAVRKFDTNLSLVVSQTQQVHEEIADLLEIKADNPFKIRAYRNGGDIIANHPHDVTVLDGDGLREIPGIGKDLAARILEISASGDCAYHRELVAEFPPSVLEMLRLQGVGPKTVATLYRELGVRTLDDLEAACTNGRVRAIKGMGPKKESLILKALSERKQYAGRHLLPEADKTAAAVVAYLHGHAPAAQITPVGSLRRGCETCGDIDLLVTGADGSLLEAFTRYPGVERVLGHGDTKSSALLHGGFQVDVRLVPADSRGAAMQYFTGSKAHNIALRDRAIGRGWKLNEYGLFDNATELPVAGQTEEGIYQALGVPAATVATLKGPRLDIINAINLGRPIPVADGFTGDVLTLDVATDSMFPNGRRMGGGTAPNRNQVNVNSVLISLIVAGNPAAGLARGVEVNDKNYLDRFPFLAPAHQGLFQGHGGTNVPTEPNIPTAN